MLFRAADLEKIAKGEITLAFRRWKKPSAKAGGTIRTAIGLLAIDSVEVIDPAPLTDKDACAAGFKDRAALMKMFAASEGDHYRIKLHFAGPDPQGAPRPRGGK